MSQVQLITVLALLSPAGQGIEPGVGGRAVPGTEIEAPPAMSLAEADDDDEAPSRRRIIGGQPVLKLSSEEQRYSGVRTLALEAQTHLPERKAYGEVINLMPLLDLRADYEAARSDEEIFAAELAASAKEYERVRALHEQGKIIAEKQVYDAEALWLAGRARLASAKTRRRDIRDKTVQEWGSAVSAMALDNDGARLKPFVTHREVLLLVTLSPDQSLPEETRAVYVDRNGNRARARNASLVSEAPGTDPARQGESYLFRCRGDGLRTGMRLDVWVPQRGEALTGVNLPRGAIVWYAGKPWVYVRTDAELFTRREVPARNEHAGGWFVQQNFQPGEEIVVSGGQMLLSEEFRWQIPEEDTSDDD